jgi:thiamine biosynthesis lipoprotein
LGAQAEITLYTEDVEKAAHVVGLIIDEVDRLENIFSLYRPGSELVRLNDAGRLDAPSFELTELLATALNFNRATGGAFDPTVQPLWELYAARGGKPGPEAVAAALELVDHRSVELSAGGIRLLRPGVGITLNGIAQGYITDRTAALLRANGFSNVLINMGEINALGRHPSGRPWRVRIPETETALGPSRTLSVSDQALATSARSGLIFDQSGGQHHIFDPRTGRSTRGIEAVSVVAPNATTADALSTALMTGNLTAIAPQLKPFGPLKILVVRTDGRLIERSI